MRIRVFSIILGILICLTSTAFAADKTSKEVTVKETATVQTTTTTEKKADVAVKPNPKEVTVKETTAVQTKVEKKADVAVKPATNDDQVSADKIAKPNPELEQASKEINKSVKKHKPLMGAGLATLAVGTVYAGSHNWHDLQDKVGVDRVAHFAVSYIINDQLQKNCGMNKFWGTMTTIAIGAAKEKWVDNKWDGVDFAADCAGAMLVNIEF